MRTHTLFKVAVLTGLLALSGCASKVTEPDKYSGFLKNYSDLKETKSATGQTVLRWVDPNYNESKYDNIVGNASNLLIWCMMVVLRFSRGFHFHQLSLLFSY